MQAIQHVICPHCWQTMEIQLDLSAGGQRYVHDCEICCNPLEITFEVQNSEITHFDVQPLGQ